MNISLLQKRHISGENSLKNLQLALVMFVLKNFNHNHALEILKSFYSVNTNRLQRNYLKNPTALQIISYLATLDNINIPTDLQISPTRLQLVLQVVANYRCLNDLIAVHINHLFVNSEVKKKKKILYEQMANARNLKTSKYC